MGNITETGVASLEGQTNLSSNLKRQKLLNLVIRPSTIHQIMPYKNYTGTPGAQANNGSTMATKELVQQIPALGDDVVMAGDGDAVAAANAAGKKDFSRASLEESKSKSPFPPLSA